MRQQQGARPTSGKRHWVSARGRGHDSRSKPRALLQPPEPALCARRPARAALQPRLLLGASARAAPLAGPANPGHPSSQRGDSLPSPDSARGQLRVRTPGSKLGSQVCRGVTWGSGAGSRLRLRGTDGGWAASVVTERGSGPSLCRSRKRPRIDPEPEVSGQERGSPPLVFPQVCGEVQAGLGGSRLALPPPAATAGRHKVSLLGNAQPDGGAPSWQGPGLPLVGGEEGVTVGEWQHEAEETGNLWAGRRPCPQAGPRLAPRALPPPNRSHGVLCDGVGYTDITLPSPSEEGGHRALLPRPPSV